MRIQPVLAALALAVVSACVAEPPRAEPVVTAEPPAPDGGPAEPGPTTAPPAEAPRAVAPSTPGPPAPAARVPAPAVSAEPALAPEAASTAPLRLGLPALALALAVACATQPALAPPAAAPAAPPVDGNRLLGARVASAGGETAGVVVDLLLEPASGAVVAAVVSVEEGPAKGELVALDWSALEPERAGPDAALEGGALALAAPDGWIEPGGADGMDLAALFDAQQPARIEGEVVAAEPLAPGSSCLVLKVRDPENLLHRVLVGAAPLVALRLPDLVPGAAVAVDAVLTRDAKGKLWIASSVGRGGDALRVRDASGALLWEELTAGLVSARGLRGAPLVNAAGAELPLDGWLFDLERGRAVALRVAAEGGALESVPWDEVVREGEAWRVASDGLRDATGEPVPAVADRPPGPDRDG